jgi:N-acetylmuramic acid 6-phosphate (MurNAc-6-P) etherase
MVDTNSRTKALPFTEMHNEMTRDLDIASPEEMVNLLNKCNSQIFEGYEGHYSLLHDNMLTQVRKVVDVVKNIVKCSRAGSRNAIVFSGCGTSGRFAFLTTKLMKYMTSTMGLEDLHIRYTIAGGDEAIVKSVEAAEDDWTAGLGLLEEYNCDRTMKSVVYIGITCGLSAPFVAGQLHFCLRHRPKFFPVVVGFNPIILAWYHLPPLFWGDLISIYSDFHGGTCDFGKKVGGPPISGGT